MSFIVGGALAANQTYHEGHLECEGKRQCKLPNKVIDCVIKAYVDELPVTYNGVSHVKSREK